MHSDEFPLTSHHVPVLELYEYPQYWPALPLHGQARMSAPWAVLPPLTPKHLPVPFISCHPVFPLPEPSVGATIKPLTAMGRSSGVTL